MLEVRRKEGESQNTLLFRFLKKVQQSGVLKEAKKRRFHKRTTSKRGRRLSALHRETRKREVIRSKKLGII